MNHQRILLILNVSSCTFVNVSSSLSSLSSFTHSCYKNTRNQYCHIGCFITNNNKCNNYNHGDSKIKQLNFFKLLPHSYDHNNNNMIYLQRKSYNEQFENDDDDHNNIISTSTNQTIQPTNIIQPFFESILLFLSTPIQLLSKTNIVYSIPLVYPIIILGLNLILDNWQSVLILDFFFVLFFTFTRTMLLIQEDNDFNDIDDNDDDVYGLDVINNNRILDLIVLFGSIISTGIISPTGISIKRLYNVNDDGSNTIAVMGLIGFGLLLLCSSSGVVNLLRSSTSDMKESNRKSLNGDSSMEGSRNNRNSNDDRDVFTEDLLSEWDRRFKELGHHDSHD